MSAASSDVSDSELISGQEVIEQQWREQLSALVEMNGRLWVEHNVALLGLGGAYISSL